MDLPTVVTVRDMRWIIARPRREAADVVLSDHQDLDDRNPSKSPTGSDRLIAHTAYWRVFHNASPILCEKGGADSGMSGSW